jgi:hypothetical protein
MHLSKLGTGILARAAITSGQRTGRMVGSATSCSMGRVLSTEAAAEHNHAQYEFLGGLRRGRPWALVAIEAGAVLGTLAVIGGAGWALRTEFATMGSNYANLDTKLEGLEKTLDAKMAGTKEMVTKEVDAKMAGTKEMVTKEVDAKLAGKEKEVDAKLAGMKELVDEKVGKKRSGW